MPARRTTTLAALLLLVLAALGGGACRSSATGGRGGDVDQAARPPAGTGMAAQGDAGSPTVSPRSDAAGRPPDAARDAGGASRPRGLLRRTIGAPQAVGCADGTREGFIDLRGWRNIAGCAGGFEVPGLLDPAARSPQCDRAAGDTGMNPTGAGCSVTDLCAQGWHVCAGPEEVARLSPTDCESAADSEHEQFFLVRSGASPQGVCGPDPTAANDLHGCGSLGQPEAESCQPLERRLSFADCLASMGAWQCGGPDDPHREATVVSKPGAAQGGALCCRDM